MIALKFLVVSRAVCSACSMMSPGSRGHLALNTVSRASALRLISVLLITAAAPGCDHFGPRLCPTNIEPAIEVQVVDSITGQPAAEDASGAVHERSFVDSLRPYSRGSDGTLLSFSAAYGRAGTYRVEVRKPGYRDWSRQGVRVRGGDCGVETTRVRAELQPEP